MIALLLISFYCLNPAEAGLVASEFPLLQSTYLQYLTQTGSSEKSKHPNSKKDGYIIAEQFYDSSTCGNGVVAMFGFAIGMCIPGVDENGDASGSILRSEVGQQGNYVRFTEAVFSSSDCKGESTSNVYIVPTTCIWDSGDFGVLYSVTTDDEPWLTGGSGLLIKNYVSSKECDKGKDKDSVDFAWYLLGGCLPDPRNVAMSFISCDDSDGKTVTTTFSDKACSSPIVSRQSSLRVCEAVTYSYAGMLPAVYQTVECS